VSFRPPALGVVFSLPSALRVSPVSGPPHRFAIGACWLELTVHSVPCDRGRRRHSQRSGQYGQVNRTPGWQTAVWSTFTRTDPVVERGLLSTVIGKHCATYGDLILSNGCKLMRSEGHLEYPFQSKTVATRGASGGKVVDLSYPAKGR